MQKITSLILALVALLGALHVVQADAYTAYIDGGAESDNHDDSDCSAADMVKYHDAVERALACTITEMDDPDATILLGAAPDRRNARRLGGCYCCMVPSFCAAYPDHCCTRRRLGEKTFQELQKEDQEMFIEELNQVNRELAQTLEETIADVFKGCMNAEQGSLMSSGSGVSSSCKGALNSSSDKVIVTVV